MPKFHVPKGKYWPLVVAAILSTGVFVLDLVDPPGTGLGILYVAAILISLWSTFRWASSAAAILCSALLVGGLLLARRGTAGPEQLEVINHLLALAAVWTTALLVQHDRRATSALAEQHDQLMRAEDAQRKAKEALQEKNAELESVLFIASHDLRSPLVTIQGFAQEIEASLEELAGRIATPGDPASPVRVSAILQQEVPEALQYIAAGVGKLDGLINGLLRLSRLGRMPFRPQSVDMNVLLQDVVDALQFQVQQRGVTVAIQPLPACEGDPTQLNQLFTNLLDNAIKYLDPVRPGQIGVSGEIDGDFVTYCVKDNGVGIAETEQSKVFDLFQRLHPDRCPGEGIGLTISQRIASRNGGRLWVRSKGHDGSEFLVSLPAALVAQPR